MHLSTHHYRCFLWVAETGSFRAAAAIAHRSQPAISLTIKEMEEALGQKLFERGQPVVLTSFGQSCLQSIQRYIKHTDMLHAALEGMSNGLVGQLNVASILSFATHWMPTLVSQFQARFPDVRLNVFDGNSEDMERQLLSGQIELAVGSRVSRDRRIAFQPILTDAFGLVCHRNHPLARKSSLTWRQIADQPIIGTVAHRQIPQSPATAFMRNRPLFVANMISLLAMLSRGTGVTVLAQWGLPPDSDDLTFIPLRRPTIARTIGIMTLADTSLSPIAVHLEQLILDITASA